MAIGLLLTLGLQGLAILETRAARSDVDHLLREAERAGRLVRSIGGNLARLRAVALEAYTELPEQGMRPEPDEVEVSASDAQALSARLERHIGELDHALGPAEAEEWRAVRPLVEQGRRDILRSLELLERGERHLAEDVLDEVGLQGRRIDQALSSLQTLTMARTEDARAGTARRLGRLALLELVLSGGLLVVLLGATLVALRLQLRNRAALAAHVERVETINDDLDQFAGRVAHDLRNILNPLGLSAELLTRAPTPETARTVAPRLRAGLQRAERVLDALLAFSRASAAPPSAGADVPEVVEQVRRATAPQAAEVEAEVEVDVAAARVATDATLLTQVLVNLVENALKHLRDASPRRVSIEGRRDEDRYELRVRDTGPGIAPELLPRLFEPFARGPDETIPGLGLGLATVRRVIEAHGGEVAAASPPGEGATFTIRLPLAGEP